MRAEVVKWCIEDGHDHYVSAKVLMELNAYAIGVAIEHFYSSAGITQAAMLEILRFGSAAQDVLLAENLPRKSSRFSKHCAASAPHFQSKCCAADRLQACRLRVHQLPYV